MASVACNVVLEINANFVGVRSVPKGSGAVVCVLQRRMVTL